MSNAVFPTLPGIAWDFKRTPLHKTTIKESVSGREYRFRRMSTPRYQYTATFEFLRDGNAGADELKPLMGFFNARGGAFDSWLFTDPDDNAVTLQSIGIADGTTTRWQLVRTLGGNVEPVYDVASIVAYCSGFGGLVRMNLLRNSGGFNAVGNAWGKQNCTAVDGGPASPDGGTSATTISRTAAGNHYVQQTYVTPYTAGATFTFSVWLKAGTLTGNVSLVLRDGAGVSNTAYAAFTPSGSWQRFSVTGTFAAGAANNINVYIDPVNDAGAAGDTLLVWGPQLEDGGAPAAGHISTAATPFYFYLNPGTGLLDASFAPPPGAVISWSGTYYWRCRFKLDQLDFTKFMARLWSLKTCEFITTRA